MTDCSRSAILIRSVAFLVAPAQVPCSTCLGCRLYVGICFLFHPLIGIAAAIGALILIFAHDSGGGGDRTPTKAAVGFAATRHALLEASRRNAEVTQAMGMGGALLARFSTVNDDYQRSHHHASDRAGLLAATTRVMRMVLQSLVLGLGAYLVINQEASAGVIIASSILMSRALAPVELAIANSKDFVAARQARRHLSEMLALLPPGRQPLSLPKPEITLSVEKVCQRQSPRQWTYRRAGCRLCTQER